MRQRCSGARGQAVPLMMLLITIGLVGVMVIARLGTTADDAARARTAADAAALAGATEGRLVARQIAEANGAKLLDFNRSGAVVEVLVEVGSVRSRARAEVTVVWDVPP